MRDKRNRYESVLEENNTVEEPKQNTEEPVEVAETVYEIEKPFAIGHTKYTGKTIVPLRLRKEPSIESAVLGTWHPGSVLTVEKENEEWLKVLAPAIGYVKAEFVALEGVLL